jgi:acetylornithine/succinyldiaminopimelate/putrescine aminotransferase
VDPSVLRELRALCDERSAALVFDEVQCGLGRTGRLFAFEHAGVRPDILALAKPLGGGLPMGAILVRTDIAGVMAPGDHATTFGGGPLVASAGRAVLATLLEDGFLSRVLERGALVSDRLGRWAASRSDIVEARGMGLMWGLQTTGGAGDVVARARSNGLLVLTAGPDVVRLLPPLTISEKDLTHGLDLLEGALG